MEKKSRLKKVLRWSRWIFIALFLFTLLAIWFSPYGYHKGFDYKLVKHSVVVNASPEKVFSYLGNSDHARDWSIFVDHIVPLPGGAPDGQKGSFRRCFCNANEKGTYWDEEITLVEKNKRRQLRIFNLVEFSVSAEGLGTEQLYKDLGNNKTELTFTVFYLGKDPSWWDEIKTIFAAYEIKRIFKGNMNNIKRLVEAQG